MSLNELASFEAITKVKYYETNTDCKIMVKNLVRQQYLHWGTISDIKSGWTCGDANADTGFRFSSMDSCKSSESFYKCICKLQLN